MSEMALQTLMHTLIQRSKSEFLCEFLSELALPSFHTIGLFLTKKFRNMNPD